jgi:hypothetical protein
VKRNQPKRPAYGHEKDEVETAERVGVEEREKILRRGVKKFSIFILSSYCATYFIIIFVNLS